MLTKALTNVFVGLSLDFAWRRHVYYFIEQPVSSVMFKYKPLLRLLKKHGAKRVAVSLTFYKLPA